VCRCAPDRGGRCDDAPAALKDAIPLSRHNPDDRDVGASALCHSSLLGTSQTGGTGSPPGRRAAGGMGYVQGVLERCAKRTSAIRGSP
jgi:hypothetical protein